MKAIESGTKGDLRAIEKLLGWYATAIPTERSEPLYASPSEPPSDTDQAILAELRLLIIEDLDDEQNADPRS